MSKICVAYGDGIGPEITAAVLDIMAATKADLQITEIEIGEKSYLRGYNAGIDDIAWKKIHANKVILKGPLTTPKGRGYKSVNVTLRKALELFANVRPVHSYQYHAGDDSFARIMDIAIIRENQEDLYSGIEYRLTHNSQLSLKLISRTGSEKIIRYAFEYARLNKREKVTCFIKSNIMKITDGTFEDIFNSIAQEYPNIAHDSMLVDIGLARLAKVPHRFDVVVTLNLYGDIASDIAAEISGSVGLAGSANLGDEYAMFEAVHGSAPDIAGTDVANPSGLLNAGIMMLRHLGQHEKAAVIEGAWHKVMADGIHTKDLYNSQYSTKLVGTKEFAAAIVSEIEKGEQHYVLSAGSKDSGQSVAKKNPTVEVKKPIAGGVIVGCDVFVENLQNPEKLASEVAAKTDLEVAAIGDKGLLIWPGSYSNVGELLQVRCLFRDELPSLTMNNEQEMTQIREKRQAEIVKLLSVLLSCNLQISMACVLHHYNDGTAGFSGLQGQ